MEKSLSLVVPCHNSERVIENSIREYHSFFSKAFKNFEIIVICNDCWDNTAKISKELEQQFPIRTIEIPQRGKGYALIKGFNEARYDLLGFLDADNPFDLNKIIEMTNHLKQREVAIVSKFLRGGIKKQKIFIRRMLSLGAFIVSRILFDMNFRDTQAGAKFFKKEVWQKVKTNYVCTGFDWDIEFLYKVKKNNFRIAEVYIPCKPEEFSTFRLKYLPGMLKRLVKLRFT